VPPSVPGVEYVALPVSDGPIATTGQRLLDATD
jgi:hypothetical protein